MEVKTIINDQGMVAPLFSLADWSQRPNLSFLDFRARPREVLHEILVNQYGRPPKSEHRLGMNTFIRIFGFGQVDRDHYIESLEKFCSVWIDWYLKTGQIVECEPGLFRRGFQATQVHYAKPFDPDNLGSDSDDLKVDQKDWTPELQAEIAEKWRLARPAKISTRDFEEMVRKMKSDAA